MSLSAESAVQEELQQYLTEKGVNTLFVKIVEQLLMEKPENPVGFMVEYLLDNFPKETDEFGKLAALTSQQRSSVLKAAGGGGGGGDAAGRDEVAEEKAYYEEESDESDEDDYVDELPEMPVKPRPAGRRTSVSAGVLSLASMQAERVVFAKDAEEATKLRSIVSGNVLCSHLDEADLDRIVDAFEKVEVAADTEVITQGDETAEHFYIMGSGAATVYKDGEHLAMVNYGPGDGFGELALMYNAPRAATVKTCEACELWRLDQVSFKVILMGSAIKKREKYSAFLEKVPIFSEMGDGERMVLADALAERTYKAGDTIVAQGDNGDEFFIVAEGAVKVERDGKFVSNLQDGAYFGEICILTSKKRQATVTADTPVVKVLTVERKVFQRVLGPLNDILSRNMDEYSKWLTN